MASGEAKDGALHWQGALTVQRTVALKDELVRVFDQHDTISIDLSAATEIDPACMQLLCSAHRTAVQRRKKLILIGRGKFSQTIGEIGFSRHIGCALDCNQSCLWVDQQAGPDLSGPLEG